MNESTKPAYPCVFLIPRPTPPADSGRICRIGFEGPAGLAADGWAAGHRDLRALRGVRHRLPQRGPVPRSGGGEGGGAGEGWGGEGWGGGGGKTLPFS